jgi:hypothetical protein
MSNKAVRGSRDILGTMKARSTISRLLVALRRPRSPIRTVDLCGQIMQSQSEGIAQVREILERY